MMMRFREIERNIELPKEQLEKIYNHQNNTKDDSNEFERGDYVKSKLKEIKQWRNY